MSRSEQLHEVRAGKLAALRESGVEPFGGAFPGRTLAADLHAGYGAAYAETLADAPVGARVAGRVVSLRPQGRAGGGVRGSQPGDLCDQANP